MAVEMSPNPEAQKVEPKVQERETWRQDLDRVGFARRILMARKWYGGDWWFVVISAIMLLFFIIVGIFPQWFAPYDPRAEVGPSLLAPGETPKGYVLIVPAGSCRRPATL